MSLEVKYLTESDEYATLEFVSGDSGPITENAVLTDSPVTTEASEKKVWKKTLVSVSGVPEVKAETCYQRVRIPFDGNMNVPYPCIKTRTSKHWIELKVFYPSDLQQDVVDTIVKCATTAAAYAAAVIAASVIAPQFIAAALPTAQGLFVEKFKSCVSEEAFKAVNFTITHEQESGDWH